MENKEQIVGQLLALYACQTQDERLAGGTHHENGAGFNMLDAPILSDMSRQFLDKGWLSDRQIQFIQTKIAKYKRQLASLTPYPVTFKTPEKPAQAPPQVIVQDHLYIVKFPYDPNKVAAIKSIYGRRWDPDKKYWTVPANEQAKAKLVEMGLVVPAPAIKIHKAPEKAPVNFDFSTFGRTLYPFQLEGVKFIERKNGRALIGDEMGLGKTIQALAYLHIHPELRPALVICPASLKLNWKREAEAAIPGIRVHLISGKKAEQFPAGDLYIINYDIVADRLDDIIKAGVKVMVLDECHHCKNRSAKRTKAIIGYKDKDGEVHDGLSKTAHVIALSGTPIVNRPIEIYPAVKMLAPQEIPSFMPFAKRYCGAYHNGYGWDFKGATNTAELHDLLTRTVMIRHLKKDVLQDLPEKQRCVVPLEMSGPAVKEYAKAQDNFLGWLTTIDPAKAIAAKNAEVLVQFQYLKQLARRGRWDAVIEWLRDALESNGKMIVFGVHHEAIDLLMTDLAAFSPVKVDGRDSQEARQAAVDRFQSDETCRLFVGNIKAAGVGLTLTAAASVVFVEFDWTPGAHVQAEDRAHRIGQRDAVTAYYLIADGTVEVEIATLLDKKAKVLDAVLDGKETDQDSLLIELLKQFQEKNKKN